MEETDVGYIMNLLLCDGSNHVIFTNDEGYYEQMVELKKRLDSDEAVVFSVTLGERIALETLKEANKDEERGWIYTALCLYLDEHGQNLNDISTAKVQDLIEKHRKKV